MILTCKGDDSIDKDLFLHDLFSLLERRNIKIKQNMFEEFIDSIPDEIKQTTHPLYYNTMLYDYITNNRASIVSKYGILEGRADRNDFTII